MINKSPLKRPYFLAYWLGQLISHHRCSGPRPRPSEGPGDATIEGWLLDSRSRMVERPLCSTNARTCNITSSHHQCSSVLWVRFFVHALPPPPAPDPHFSPTKKKRWEKFSTLSQLLIDTCGWIDTCWTCCGIRASEFLYRKSRIQLNVTVVSEGHGPLEQASGR